jgi:hypothetical protein
MTEAPVLEEIFNTYKDQGLEVVAFGADWYPDGPYTCQGWDQQFNLSYPILDFETGLENWYWESAPYDLYQPELGWGLPFNVIINHEMEVLWGAAANFEGDVMAEAIGVIESALQALNEEFPDGPGDDDGDGIANGCDPCPESHLHHPGNFDFSQVYSHFDNGAVFVPSVDIFDLILFSDYIMDGGYLTDCILEAHDITGDGFVNPFDVIALAQLILGNDWGLN